MALQEVLEAEMTEALGAEKGERTSIRQGYRSGYYGRTLITRVGKLELRVLQDRSGRFSTELFERYQRLGALVAALAEMYVQGCQCRLNFLHLCRSKIPQIRRSAISRPADRLLVILADVRGEAARLVRLRA
jgi:transposase-like protein